MAASNAISSQYSRLLRSGYVVAEITSIGDLSRTHDDIDVTNYDSDDEYKEYIPGMTDGGELSIEGNFIVGDTNGQLGLMSDREAGTLQTFELAMPNAANSSWEFTAYVKDFGTSQPLNDKISFKATLRISGKPTLIRGTGSTGLTTPYFTLYGNYTGTITPSPSASGSVFLYSASCHNLDATLTVTPTATAGTIKVNGTTVSSGIGEDISLTEGDVTPIFVSVKESGKAIKIYKINADRPSA